MIARTWPRVGPIGRLTVGLLAIGLSVLMLMNLVFEVIPDGSRETRQLRQRFAESLAVQVASLVEVGDERTLNRTLQEVVTRNPDVLSAAVRQVQGYVLAQRGDHARHWVGTGGGARSTLDRVKVPIQAQREVWGYLELAYADTRRQGLSGWAQEPAVLFGFAFLVGGAFSFYPYLRRALHYLDPTSVVPDRVRKAFDTLSCGIVVVGPDGRIVLANAAFRRLHPAAGKELHGRSLDDLPWLNAGAGGEERRTVIPWADVFRAGRALEGQPLSIPRPDSEPVETIVQCSPIADDDGRVRGCIVSFDDVTEIQRTNDQLRRALDELQRSREQVQAQNEELQRLATRDPMTGCLNRRAFFDVAETVFDERVRTNGELACIMLDIDHFKSFNDLYGHTVGDQVIIVVARALMRLLRPEDVVCRYGGEEFAIVLPDANLAGALAVAERLRAELEANASGAIRSTRVQRITASLGVASVSQGAVRLAELIDQADNALYRSKEAGRNRVTAWEQTNT